MVPPTLGGVSNITDDTILGAVRPQVLVTSPVTAGRCARKEGKMLEQEMQEAGFSLWFRGPRLASDRFLMVFGKTHPGKVASGLDQVEIKK